MSGGQVELRLIGEMADAGKLVDLLAAVGCEVRLNPREYSNHGGSGVRLYAAVKLPD